MKLSDERIELEDRIYGNLSEIRKNLLKAASRIQMARSEMQREPEGSARIVPEDKTMRQDILEAANKIADAHSDLDARMEDYQNLLDLIEEERKEDKE